MPKNWNLERDFNVIFGIALILIVLMALMIGHELFIRASNPSPVIQSAEIVYTHFTIVVSRGEISQLWLNDTLEYVGCDAYQNNDNGHNCIMANHAEILAQLHALNVDLPHYLLP